MNLQSLDDDPHRKFLVDCIGTLPSVSSVAEIGCNWGPNLLLLRRRFTDVQLHGVDINARSLERARSFLTPPCEFHPGTADRIPLSDKAVDVAFTDATLIYVGPDKIRQALDELLRVTRRSVVICEWHSRTDRTESMGDVWLHPYARLLEQAGAHVVMRDFPRGSLDATQRWDCGPGWRERAAIFVATPPDDPSSPSPAVDAHSRVREV